MTKVNTEILIRVGFGIVGDLEEPGARHHDRGRSHEAALDRVDSGGVGGVTHAGIVAVYDQQFICRLVAKPLDERRAVGLGQAGDKRIKKQGYQGCFYG